MNADSISMKTEFQRILDKHLNKSHEKQESANVVPDTYIYVDLEPKLFGQGKYKGANPQEVLKFKYERLLKEWLEDIDSEDLKSSIQIFYDCGARNFLSRDLKDIKKDYRRLVMEYHPDRAVFQQKYSFQECHNLFLRITEAYKKLISQR